MLVNIADIKINSGRREVRLEDVEKLSKSISQVGLLNPVTITPGHILIAGNHRLEAAKLLGWTEIECTVCDVSGLLAELAEIDENFVRKNLSPIEFGDLLLRRKEIYEELHPETKATKEGGPFRGNQHDSMVTAESAVTTNNVVNGQHRIAAIRKITGGKDVLVNCLVYTGMTYEQEAAMYFLLDKTTGHLKLANAVKALLESGTDPTVIDIKQRIERAGFIWALDKPTGVTYELKPVRAVMDAYAQLGAPGFSRMLGLMAGAWHGAQVSLTGGMISGMALFLKAHENELDDYTAIQRLSAIDPTVIAQLAQVDSPPLRYARLIRQKYNEWPSGEKLSYRFNK